MNDSVLQSSQFFRERIARGERYEKEQHQHSSHNGHSAKDDEEDHGRDGEQSPDEVREILAHQNVFHRP